MVILNKNASLGLSVPFLEIVSLLFLIVLFRWWYKEKKAWGLALIIFGGLLNLIERFYFGGVRDYWQIPMTNIYNNLNDYFIVGGFIQVIWYFIWKKKQK